MEMVSFEATKRTETGKGPSKRYRREGLVPSIIYGQGENTNILINNKEFGKLAQKITKSTLLNITVEGKKFEVFVKDYQKDYLSGNFVHVDFYEIKKGKKIHFTIPFKLEGNPLGVREGGIMEKHLTGVEVECLPKDAVQYFTVDISNVLLGGTLHVSDVQFDDKYRILTPMEEVVIHISGKAKGDASAAEADEAAAVE